jgi:uncharacterized membrane protein SpoIIM required for sporulation
MVLELLTNPFRAKQKPLQLFFIGFVYATAGLFLANWIFKEQASMIMVFITVLGCLPLVYNTIKEEAVLDLKIAEEKRVLVEHGKVFLYLMLLFLGFTAAYCFWYLILPGSLVHSIFNVQSTTIEAINTKISGNFISNTLINIFLNNIKVLVLCTLFSFLYGAGAIFILTWNASVISTAIGNFVRTNLENYSSTLGFTKVASYLHILSLGFLRYMLHGIPEILAYFIAAVAGGLISIAVMSEKLGTKNFEKMILDSTNLIIASVIILAAAAFIEVFITPLLF